MIRTHIQNYTEINYVISNELSMWTIKWSPEGMNPARAEWIDTKYFQILSRDSPCVIMKARSNIANGKFLLSGILKFFFASFLLNYKFLLSYDAVHFSASSGWVPKEKYKRRSIEPEWNEIEMKRFFNKCFVHSNSIVILDSSY